MVRKVIEKFSVEWLQILEESGKVDEKLMPALSQQDILDMHGDMVTARILDDKMFKLQRQGRLGTFGQSVGQEACQIGTTHALEDEDWVFPAFREHAAFVSRKFPLSQYIQYWGGDERGGQTPKGINMFTVAIPVATQIPHAVGLAWAMKLKNKKNVAIVYFGDGATSRGDFHEGMNFAGTFKIPCVFICQNNQWAISVPVSRQTAAKTLAQKALAYGFNGIRVDGNDVFAVYAAAKEAVELAKNGGGPTLIECLTYRMSDHTTSDDSKRYRSQEEVEEWRKKDPITRLEKYMITKKIFTQQDRDRIWAETTVKVEEAVKEYEKIAPPDVEDMFSFVFAKITPEMQEQLDEVKKTAAEKPKAATAGSAAAEKDAVAQ